MFSGHPRKSSRKEVPVGVLEEILGFVLGIAVLVDLFLLILYARANKTIFSTELSHLAWRTMVGISKPFGRWRETFLSLSGPVILVLVIGVWLVLLTVAAAFVIHPNLGTGVVSNQGETPTDFITALYAAGSSLSFVGASDFSPHDWFFRSLYILNSLIGLTLASLLTSYLLQLYENLKERNALGLKVNIMSAETGDASEIVAHLGPQGKFENGYNNIVDWSAETATVKESHHFYPMLFFFRFREPYYSVSRTTLTSLDTVSLIKSALDNQEYGWLKESAAVNDLWRASMKELQTLARDFLPNEDFDVPPDPRTMERWRKRYEMGVDRIKAAGAKTTPDGLEDYISLRKQWDRMIYMVAPKFAFDLNEVDTAMAKVK
jgi:hypothetical protein